MVRPVIYLTGIAAIQSVFAVQDRRRKKIEIGILRIEY
jgi:hypothetical protein